MRCVAARVRDIPWTKHFMRRNTLYPKVSRRQFCLWAASGGFTGAGSAAADPHADAPDRQVIGDMHSHFDMFAKRLFRPDLGRQMLGTGTTLVAWAVTDDGRWVHATPHRLEQFRQPEPGELWDYFEKRMAACSANLAAQRLPLARTAEDVDAALAGAPHVVLATEAANFLEGQPQRVAVAHAWGVRHLQLVHYIRSPLGDLQTAEPQIGGFTPVAAQVIAECKRLGIVVDLAHSTPAFFEAALDASDAAMLWSHSWIRPDGGHWQDDGHIARALSPSQAKLIAAHGGVVGLWSAREPNDHTYPVNSISAYADEIVRMCDLLGPTHVGFGTDMDGVGQHPVLSDYSDLRAVADNLERRGLDRQTFSDICIGNYARVLKQAMSGAAPGVTGPGARRSGP
jgi:membrane dipeptidase